MEVCRAHCSPHRCSVEYLASAMVPGRRKALALETWNTMGGPPGSVLEEKRCASRAMDQEGARQDIVAEVRGGFRSRWIFGARAGERRDLIDGLPPAFVDFYAACIGPVAACPNVLACCLSLFSKCFYQAYLCALLGTAVAHTTYVHRLVLKL